MGVAGRSRDCAQPPACPGHVWLRVMGRVSCPIPMCGWGAGCAGACNRVPWVPEAVASLGRDSLSVPDRSDPLEKMAVLVSLGIFAFFVLAAVLVITILIW